MAAASVSAAEGVSAGGERAGSGPQACAGALLRRMGPHASDSGSVQTDAGSLLQDHPGLSLTHTFVSVNCGLFIDFYYFILTKWYFLSPNPTLTPYRKPVFIVTLSDKHHLLFFIYFSWSPQCQKFQVLLKFIWSPQCSINKYTHTHARTHTHTHTHTFVFVKNGDIPYA